MLTKTVAGALLVLLCALFIYGDRAPAKKWEPGVITYYNDSGWRQTLHAAAKQWNDLDFGVSFSEVDLAEEADLVIVDMPRLELPCSDNDCIGHSSSIGPSTEQNIVSLLPPKNSDGVENNRDLDNAYLPTIIHELGHVLGLRHPSDDKNVSVTASEPCAVMNSGDKNCDLSAFYSSYKRDPGEEKALMLPCGPYSYDREQLEKLYDVHIEGASIFCEDRYWLDSVNIGPAN